MFPAARRIVRSRVFHRQFSAPAVTEIKKVGVVGLGLMGHGVVQIAAEAGYQVVAIESQEAAITSGVKRIEDSLKKVNARLVKKNVISEEDAKLKIEQTMARISTTTKVADAASCDLIVEAIVEDMDVKLAFYKELGGLIKPEAIFASNTSSLQITEMALASGRPDRFIGLHFFNPVQMMKLCEVIQTEHSSSEVNDLVTAFGQKIGKTTVSCMDTPGFIVNRLLVPYMASAMSMLDRGDATVKDIDVSMMLGAGHPMGPLTLADYVGLDTCLSILKGWKKDYPDDPSFVIPKCLVELVNNKQYGRKSGAGFYTWEGDKPMAPVPRN